MLQTDHLLTADEYLSLERRAKERHEFVDGEIFAMAGASRKHNIISTNIIRTLGNQLETSSCHIYASDMKVRIEKPEKYTYPDIIVSCNEEVFADEQEDILLNPRSIIEILSDSTEAYDRGLKFSHYQSIKNFQEYILISQNAYRVEQFTRRNDNFWLYCDLHDLQDILESKTVPYILELHEIYRGMEL